MRKSSKTFSALGLDKIFCLYEELKIPLPTFARARDFIDPSCEGVSSV